MITTITIENFKGVKRQEFVFNRVSAVVDRVGVDAFLLFDALWLLDRLVRGMVAASAPYGWIGESHPTSIKVTINNVQTGEVRSPYPDIDVSQCRRYAFSGIHVFSPRLFERMEGWPPKFSIIDFYLKICAQAKVQGYVKDDLKLMDVGKIDTLDQAEIFLQQIAR